MAKITKDASLAEELPYWDFFEQPRAHAVLQDGSIVAGLKVGLIDVECFDENEMNQLTVGLRNALNSVSEGASLQFLMSVEAPGGPSAHLQSARGLVSESNSVHEAQSHCRILISKDASLALDEASAKVVDGFDGGHITRAQIASWWILKSAERMTVTDIKEIRAAYFDKIAYLENLLKRAKETGIAPAELDAICPGTGGTVVSRRQYIRRPKAATPPCT